MSLLKAGSAIAASDGVDGEEGAVVDGHCAAGAGIQQGQHPAGGDTAARAREEAGADEGAAADDADRGAAAGRDRRQGAGDERTRSESVLGN